MRCPRFQGNLLWGSESPLGGGDRGLDELVTKRKWFLLAATVLPVVLIPIVLAVHLTSPAPGQEAFFFAFGRLPDFSLFACIKAALCAGYGSGASNLFDGAALAESPAVSRLALVVAFRQLYMLILCVLPLVGALAGSTAILFVRMIFGAVSQVFLIEVHVGSFWGTLLSLVVLTPLGVGGAYFVGEKYPNGDRVLLLPDFFFLLQDRIDTLSGSTAATVVCYVLPIVGALAYGALFYVRARAAMRLHSQQNPRVNTPLRFSVTRTWCVAPCTPAFAFAFAFTAHLTCSSYGKEGQYGAVVSPRNPQLAGLA